MIEVDQFGQGDLTQLSVELCLHVNQFQLELHIG